MDKSQWQLSIESRAHVKPQIRYYPDNVFKVSQHNRSDDEED